MALVLRLVDMALAYAASLRGLGRAITTFAAGFLATFAECSSVDEWIKEYSDAWDKLKPLAGTATDRKILKENAGTDASSASHKAHVKADAANKTLTKLKVYKSTLTGLLAMVREVDRKLAWDDITVDEWNDVRSTATLAGSIENIDNYLKYGGTPDEPNKAPTVNRTAGTDETSEDLEAAIEILITEVLDETAAKAAMLALGPIFLGARERIARK